MVRDRTAKLPRVLGAVGDPSSDCVLVAIGGLHGNEPSGVLGVQRVLARLSADATGLVGRFVGLAGNRAALASDERFVERDLNRMWIEADLERIRGELGELFDEEAELKELDHELRGILHAAPGACILDLHSTSGGGAPFVILDDTLANRRVAFPIPATHVLGLEEEIGGTMIGYLNSRGVTAVCFEAGKHLDPGSVDRAESAVWIALEAIGVLAPNSRPEVERSRRFLRQVTAGLPDVVELRDRHPVHVGDGFRMNPGFRNFDPIRRDQAIAEDRSGPIRPSETGMILMPLYQSQGEDGFFVVRPVRAAWLTVSSWLRRCRFDRVLHWLPGVTRHPEERGIFFVDQSRARWLALEVFHLLGYARTRHKGDTLRMRKRDPRRA